MLTINGQKIDPKTPEGKFVEDTLSAIQKEKNFVIFQDQRMKMAKMRPIVNATGQKVGEADLSPIMIPNIDYLIASDNKGVEISPCTVAFTEKTVSIQKDGIIDIKKDKIFFKDFKSLNPGKRIEAEQIFFLRYCSSITRKSIIFEFVEKDEDKKSVSKIMRDSEVDLHIFHTLHPDKYGSEVLLRKMAAAWNVNNADDLSIDKLCLKLRDTILESEKNKASTKRGIKEFVEDVQSIQSGNFDIIKLRADMQKALDKKIIIYDNNRCIFMKDSPIEKELFRVPPSDLSMMFEKLVYHCKNNPTDKDNILSELYELSTETDILVREINAMTDEDEVREMAIDRELDLRGAPKIDKIKERIIKDIIEKGR